MRIAPWRKRTELPKDLGAWPTRLRNEMDRLFDRFLGDPWRGESAPATYGGWEPDIDVKEGEKEITVRAEVPGIDAKDVQISVTGNTLTISGEKRESKEEKKEDYHCTECLYGAFHRTIDLPESANPDDVKADYDKGVLTVRIAKKDGAKPRRIEVKAAQSGDGDAAGTASKTT